jgi:hypothetical protein
VNRRIMSAIKALENDLPIRVSLAYGGVRFGGA